MTNIVSPALIAAQVYGGSSAARASTMRGSRETAFSAQMGAKPGSVISEFSGAQQRPNPTLQPGQPQPLEPARRLDEGRGRRDAVQAPLSAMPERPGTRINIVV